MAKTIGNGSIPLRIGNLIDTHVYGGPYVECPSTMFGVRMAVELPQLAADVVVPTKDYSVPKVSDLRAGIVRALMAMINGQSVYAGCMGGIGRTGIFLAALAKVQIEYRKSKHRAGRGEDPVLYVRRHFIPHAVETQQQVEYLANFDVSEIVNWLDNTQVAMGLGGLTSPKLEAHPSTPFIIKFTDEKAQDNFKAGWKKGLRERVVVYEVERDDYDFKKGLLESEPCWVDDPEADSAYIEHAEGGLPDDAEYWNGLAMSLQSQIDELQDQVDEMLVMIRDGAKTRSQIAKALHLLSKMLKEHVGVHLTNASLCGKIRSRFRNWIKNSNYEGM